jgi:hypothetical protein
MLNRMQIISFHIQTYYRLRQTSCKQKCCVKLYLLYAGFQVELLHSAAVFLVVGAKPFARKPVAAKTPLEAAAALHFIIIAIKFRAWFIVIIVFLGRRGGPAAVPLARSIQVDVLVPATPWPRSDPAARPGPGQSLLHVAYGCGPVTAACRLWLCWGRRAPATGLAANHFEHP